MQKPEEAKGPFVQVVTFYWNVGGAACTNWRCKAIRKKLIVGPFSTCNVSEVRCNCGTNDGVVHNGKGDNNSGKDD